MKINKKTKTKLAIYIALVLTFNFGFTPVFAAGDPISVVNNLSDFIFSLIRAIGMILLGFGVVQIGLCRWCYHYFCKRNFESYCRWIIAFTKKGGMNYGGHIRQPTKCFTDME